MKFKTPYDFGSSEFFTRSGEPKRPVYKPVLQKDGSLDLVEDGFEDVYAKIQSFKDSVDINVILERYSHGDVYALEQSVGMYGDFVNVPRSYMEALNAVVDARTSYELTDMSIPFDEYVDKALNAVNKALSKASKSVDIPVENEVIDNVPESE